ncbi:MAG: acyl-CoA dehydrogenase family protein, partial [Halieaceae bacterium]
MDFGFSEAQLEVQGLARQILADQVTADKLAAYDEYAEPRFDRALWQQLLDAGLPGVAVDEQYGGMGLGFTELALFVEEVGRTIAPVPAISHCVSAMLPIQAFAPQAVCEALLPMAARGEILLTAALTEPLNEFVGQPTLTSVQRDGDGFLVTGSKFAVPFASSAHRILLAARHGDDVAVLLIDPQAPGVTLAPIEA